MPVVARRTIAIRRTDDTISPYLRRPVRSYAEFVKERAKRATETKPDRAPVCSTIRMHGRAGSEDAEPRG